MTQTGTGKGALQQGQFTYGPTPFDMQQDAAAQSDNLTSLVNRYAQLGLGGSTMQGQDLAGTQLATQALMGQQQTAEVGQAATNPALQPATTTPSSSSGLGSLLGTAGSGALGSGTQTV